MNNYKTIGIIGGQGPRSTADIYMKIVQYYRDNFNARYVKDFPPMIIFSVPTPDLVESIENEAETFDRIAEAIKKLEKDGADFIIIACNSLQYMLERFRGLVTIPIIGIAEVVAEHIKEKGYKKIGILGTKTTVDKQVYDKDMKSIEAELVKLDSHDMDIMTGTILNEIAGTLTNKDSENVQMLIKHLHDNGAEVALLVCTDLLSMIEQQNPIIPIIDCNDLYAQYAAKYASKES